jgi:hypothetical protein
MKLFFETRPAPGHLMYLVYPRRWFTWACVSICLAFVAYTIYAAWSQ